MSNILGVISRKVQAQIIKQANIKTINTFICNTIDRSNVIFTDSFNGYNKIYEHGYKHYIINHSEHFTTTKTIHTNTIESFWAYAKKCFRLTHGDVKKYFYRFLTKIIFTLQSSNHQNIYHIYKNFVNSEYLKLLTKSFKYTIIL